MINVKTSAAERTSADQEVDMPPSGVLVEPVASPDVSVMMVSNNSLTPNLVDVRSC